MADQYEQTIVLTYEELVDKFGRTPPPASFDGTFRFEDISGQLGDPTTLTATNASPTQPQGLAITTGLGGAVLTWTKSAETDLKRTRMYRSTTTDASDFAWTDSVGPYDTSYIDDPGVGTYYYSLRFEDVFDQTSPSAEYKAGSASIGIRGWSHNVAFASSGSNEVTWAAGSIYVPDGPTVYEVSASSTDAMTDMTFIYFDWDVISTSLLHTTAASESVGHAKILVAVAEDVPTTGKAATFTVFGAGDGKGLIVADEIAANVITAGEIDAGTITACQITGTTLAAIYADLGTITAGEITGVSASFGGSNEVILDNSGVSITAWPGGITPTIEHSIKWYDGANLVTWMYGQVGGGLNVFGEASFDNDVGITGSAYVIDGLHVGGAGDPGVDNLVVDGDIFVGTTYNATMTQGITVSQGANDNEIAAWQSTDVSHGMSDHTAASSFGALSKAEATSGGLHVIGYKDGDGAAGYALALTGRLGEAADTTKTTAAIGVVQVAAQVESGTGITTVGADGNLMVIANSTTARFIFDAEGSAHGDVEWVAFDEQDDVELLDKLEQTATSKDVVTGEMGEFLEQNKRELKELGIAHFDDKPGHAMVNFTKLSMLLVGGIKQLSKRVERMERLLLPA